MSRPDVLQANPLVVRCGGFGEIVLMTPLLEQLWTRLGRPVDVIASGAWATPLLEGLPSAGEVRVLDSRNTPYWLNVPQRRLVGWLRGRGPGPVWYCDAHRGMRDLLRRAQVPDDHVCDAAALPGVEGEHIVDRWIRFAASTPPAFAGQLPETSRRVPSQARLEISTAAEASFAQWRRQMRLPDSGYVVIQAGNKRNMRGLLRGRSTNTKHWPEARWAELIRAIRERYPHDMIVLLGVRREYGLNADIMRLAGVRGVCNAAGTLPVRTLLPLLRGARGMISVDTGPAHAAAALGCPTVALFGVADPRHYCPGGVTTRAIALSGQIDGRPSIRAITVGAVLEAWGALVQDRGGTTALAQFTERCRQLG